MSNNLEKNKLFAAILIALLVGLVASLLAGALVQSPPLEKPVYIVEGVGVAITTPTNTPKGPGNIDALLAHADIAAGKDVSRKCLQCHTFDKGGANKVGPNLWDVVGAPIAEGRSGFAFSPALKAKGGAWTVEALNHFLYEPRTFAKGTKMSFIGLPKDADRANLIAYLQTLKD